MLSGDNASDSKLKITSYYLNISEWFQKKINRYEVGESCHHYDTDNNHEDPFLKGRFQIDWNIRIIRVVP